VQGDLRRSDATHNTSIRGFRSIGIAAASLPLVAAMAVSAPLSSVHAAAATVVAPTYVRTIGTSGESTMYPSGVAVDASGNVYVADTGNYQIEKYQAGTTNLLWSVGVRGEPIGPAGSGNDSFTAPRDLATDGTYVYVADTDNADVQVLNASTGAFIENVKTFGSGGTQKFEDPIGISVGHNGSLEEILVSDGVSGNVYVFGFGSASAPMGSLLFAIPPYKPTSSSPAEGTRDAATDSAGNIFTADYRGNRVDEYGPTDSTGATPILSFGGGTSTNCADVAKPYGIDIDTADTPNRIYVASSDLEQVKVFDDSGNCLDVGTTGNNAIGTKVTAPSNTGIFQLRRVAVGAGPNPLIYLADLWGLKILTYSSATGAISSAQPMLGSGTYPAAGGLNEDHGIAIDPSTNQIFVTNTVNQRMERFNLDGTDPIDWGTKGVQEVTFNWAQGVGYDPADGNVWVANTRNNRIDEFTTDGTDIASCPNTQRLTSTFNWPMAVAFDPSGTMYVADTYNNRVEALSTSQCAGSTTADPIWSEGVRGSGTGDFIKPWDIVFDPTQDRLLVLDTDNSRIVSLNPSTGAWNGVLPITKGTGAGQIEDPEGIAVDASGNIWVADTGNNRVEEFTSAGVFANQMIGTYGTSGNASFNAPQGLAFDSAGLLYVADANNNRIQVYQPQAAGSSVPTYQGDLYNAGGVAPMYPAGGEANASGTMFIADSGGSRIDEITSGGALSYITPATGTPLSNPRNLSLDVSNPNDMWVTDTGNNGLIEMTTSGTVLLRLSASTTPALTLMSPFGNANDANNVYIADTYDKRVIAVSKTTDQIVWSTTTSCPSPGGKALSRVRDVAVGSDGNIYAVDTDNNRVVEFAASNGACVGTPWAGGPLKANVLHQPRAIASDGAGGLWIAEDGQTPAIVHYSDAGVFIGKTLNTGTGGAGFIEPEGVFTDGSNLVAADPFANQIITFSVSSGVPAAAGTALNKGGPVLGGFNNPFGVAYAPNGDCFVTDMFNQRIEKFTGCTGTPIATGNFGGGNGNMQNPRGITVSSDGSTVILDNSEDERIDFFSASTLAYESSISAVLSTCGNKNLFFPHQVAYDATNNSYWVADTNNNRIVDLSAASGTLGDCLANWTGTGTVVKAPRGIAWDGTNVWVSNAQTGQILKCTTAGACTAVAKRTGTPTKVNSPWNLTIANGDLYIADEGAGSIVVMNMASPYNEIETFGTLGSNPSLGQLGSPRSVSVNPLNGEIAVADFNNNDISFWK
jgi:DNA-binding beta-propeller fold protein YncE